MKPVQFKSFVYEIADSVDFPRENIILGGDHLGPLKWSDESEEVAMEKSKELVKSYVLAGFKKIHLDTSMRLAGDNKNESLSNNVIARRGAVLYKTCEEAYQELLKENPDEKRPVYIIGSEVPSPGGAKEEEGSINITSPAAVSDTIYAYESQLKKNGYENGLKNIIGIVVQPGVEFNNTDVHHYNRDKAKELSKYLKRYDKIVFEGHSTDYQSSKNLKRMVEDGFGILKVGPALTFALREGLFSLSMIEKELIKPENRSDFTKVLQKIMENNPGNWMNHYSGLEDELQLQRKYSFSDRCRYYFSDPQVIEAIDKLFENLNSVEIPLCMLSQFMPNQYIKARDKIISLEPKELVIDKVIESVSYTHLTLPTILRV